MNEQSKSTSTGTKRKATKSTKKNGKSENTAFTKSTAAPKQANISTPPEETVYGDQPQDFSASDSTQETTSAAKGPDWGALIVRGLFMVGYGFVAWFVLMAGFALVIIQFVVNLIQKKPHAQLSEWISSIGKYLNEIFDYLSMTTDEKPFPLGKPFP